MTPLPTGRVRQCPSCHWHPEYTPHCPLCDGTGLQQQTTPLSEPVAENRVKKWVASRGGLALKVNTLSISGMPDRMVMLPGDRRSFWELKSGKHGTLSPRQKEAIKLLRKLGVRVYVVNSVETLEAAKKDAIRYYV